MPACYDRDEMTRRQLVGRGIGAGLTLYAAKLLTVDRLVEAAQAQAAPEAPVLVSVFLPGGCDLLAALPPLEQLGRLNDLRSSLNVGDAVSPLPNESRLGFHPALADAVDRTLRLIEHLATELRRFGEAARTEAAQLDEGALQLSKGRAVLSADEAEVIASGGRA